MKKLLIGTALLSAPLPFTFDGVTPTVSKADAKIGRPLTPLSVAGVHRRAVRRTNGVYGYHPVARAALAGAAVGATAYGAGYYDYAGGGGWGWNRPLYMSAALGSGGYGYGMTGYGCYPTFNYSTGWNQFCPGSGFVFGTGSNHQ
jgi:hypothetical protein